MKYVWQDLSKPLNVFTARNATMRDLNKNKIVQYYAANTKIMVTQKCVTESGTFYRTESAKEKGLNWAFEAAAFGLPNEFAPPAPIDKSHLITPDQPVTRTRPVKKQTPAQKAEAPKGGEEPERQPLWRRLFGRKHG